MKDLEKLMNQKALEKVASETGNKYLEKIAERNWDTAGDDTRSSLMVSQALPIGIGGTALGAVLAGRGARGKGALAGAALGGIVGAVSGNGIFNRYRGATPEEMDKYYNSNIASSVENDYQTRLGAALLRDELKKTLAKERLEYLLSNVYTDDE